jgi:hypothetical protein
MQKKGLVIPACGSIDPGGGVTVGKKGLMEFC